MSTIQWLRDIHIIFRPKLTSNYIQEVSGSSNSKYVRTKFHLERQFSRHFTKKQFLPQNQQLKSETLDVWKITILAWVSRSMRDFCHEAPLFLRVLTLSRYRITHSSKKNLRKYLFYETLFNSYLLLLFTRTFMGLYCFSLNVATDCHVLT